ncbi:MAG: hypothetical protein M3Y34_08375 [Actinomycetota bacterium]|nr:hypothetical protein [Actinomycetota bacterium]
MRAGKFGISGAIVVLGLFAGSAAAGTVDTSITIKEDGGVFRGKVKSEISNCVDGRAIKVMKQRPGRDLKVAIAGTDSDGSWKSGDTNLNKGTFYARVLTEGDCEGATSRKVTI